MELRWAIGCRSRKLCWGNVCLGDWTVPWVHVNWAPSTHLQAHIWPVEQVGRSSLLLDVPFWDCNRNGFFCFPSFTFWQRAGGFFLVKVSKWLSWTATVWPPGHHFVLGWNILSKFSKMFTYPAVFGCFHTYRVWSEPAKKGCGHHANHRIEMWSRLPNF